MNRLFYILIIFSGLLSMSARGQNSENTPSMIGFSLNHAIWSNNLGPVINIEIAHRPRRTIKLEVGYLVYAQSELITLNSYPEGLEPRIQSFSGLKFGAEYKLYRRPSWKGDFFRRYFSAYYEYRYLSGSGYALNRVYENTESSFVGFVPTISQLYHSDQNEQLNEFGLKIGSLHRLGVIKSRPILMDVFLGLAFQVVLQDLILENSYHSSTSSRIHFRKLKNSTLFGTSELGDGRSIYAVPILKFGVNINLAFPKS